MCSRWIKMPLLGVFRDCQSSWRNETKSGQTKSDVKDGTTSESGKSVFLEDAIVKTGFGSFQIIVAVVCGLGAFSQNTAIYAMSFILPTLTCDFKMTSAEQTLITSASFAGMIFSTHLCGYWSDTYGRRHLLWRSSMSVGLLLIFMAFAPSAPWFIVILFLIGFTGAGINIAVYVYTSENCSNLHRGSLLIILSVLSNTPFFVLPILSGLIFPLDIDWNVGAGFVVSPWRFLLLICSIPNLACAVVFFILPESPKFELARGDVLRTMSILRTMFRVNTGKAKSQYPVSSVTLDNDDVIAPISPGEGILKGLWKQNAALFRRDYLKYTIFQCFVCMVCIGGFNMVFMWLPKWNSQLAAAGGLGFTLCDTFQCKTTVELPSSGCGVYDMSAFHMNIYIGAACFFCMTPLMKLASFFEKRRIIVYLQIGSAIGFLSVTFAKSIILTNVLLGTSAILLVVAFPLCVNIIVDFFPTNLRSTATCLGFFTGRVGAALMVQVMGSFQQCYCYYLLYSVVAILLGIALMAILMPLKKKNHGQCQEKSIEL